MGLEAALTGPTAPRTPETDEDVIELLDTGVVDRGDIFEDVGGVVMVRRRRWWEYDPYEGY